MLQGKKGIVFGVANSHSIAYAVAAELRRQGAWVVASCLNDKARAVVAPDLQALGIEVAPCNFEEAAQPAAFVEWARQQLGSFDFIVHSVAWAPLGDLQGRVIDSSADGFSRAMRISCHSFAEVARACAPLMPQGGSLLTMTYIGADEAVPHYGLMGPVKAALESLVRYMAVELGPQNIRVHAVSPGPIATRAASGIAKFDELMADALKKSPLGRLATAEEVAHLSAFLCSPASSGMTGQTIYVDAGAHGVG